MTLKSDTKFKEKLICHIENDMGNLVIFDWDTQTSQNLNFDGLLVPKVYKEWLKKLSRSYVHDTNQWCKIWRTYLLLQKWYEKFGEFTWKYSKNSKLELWWVPFVQNTLKYEIKNYRGVMCNNIEEWCKFEMGLICRLKNDLTKMVSFDLYNLKLVSKFALWLAHFVQSIKGLSQKLLE